jgi:predicted glycogen debranching enzyme
MLAKFEETIVHSGISYELSSNRWNDGVVAPEGHELIESFRLEGTIPIWRFACNDAIVEKRIWMERGHNTTYVRYTALLTNAPITLSLRALINYRSHHDRTRAADWNTKVTRILNGLSVLAFPEAEPLYLTSDRGTMHCEHDWYYGFLLECEQERGLDAVEDHLHVATLTAELAPGQSLVVVASTEPDAANTVSGCLSRRRIYEADLLRCWGEQHPDSSRNAPAWIRHLVLAADQFIVDRSVPGFPHGKSVIAGYPWFEDWGRDTMIALAGLTLATGRPNIARSILLGISHYVSHGMLPNRFPDFSSEPDYNTVDATLWYFQAIRAWYQASGDGDGLTALFPVLVEIIDAHLRSTRYHIGVDPNDGLLYAGEPGIQLTWMDAKISNWVVTPRIGKLRM